MDINVHMESWARTCMYLTKIVQEKKSRKNYEFFFTVWKFEILFIHLVEENIICLWFLLHYIETKKQEKDDTYDWNS